jgi:hypothetical protein
VSERRRNSLLSIFSFLLDLLFLYRLLSLSLSLSLSLFSFFSHPLFSPSLPSPLFFPSSSSSSYLRESLYDTLSSHTRWPLAPGGVIFRVENEVALAREINKKSLLAHSLRVAHRNRALREKEVSLFVSFSISPLLSSLLCFSFVSPSFLLLPLRFSLFLYSPLSHARSFSSFLTSLASPGVSHEVPSGAF